VLSAHADRYYMKEVLSTGAYGYLVKDEAPRLIVDAVRGAAMGQTGWMSRSAAAEMSSLVFREDVEPGPITAREHEVMRLIAAGKTNQEIGRELRISEKTVEKHVSALLEKLNVSSRTQVAVHAVRRGLA
jgi:DNA-binding NarL/FixJ family response regulator